MPIFPNWIERTLFLRLNVAPAPLLDILSTASFRAACSAQKLGIFDALQSGPMTSAQLARQVLRQGNRGPRAFVR